MSKRSRASARKKWKDEHGITFTGFSVRAILAGRKTVTRRVVAIPPKEPTFRGGWEADVMGGPLMKTSAGDTLEEFPVLWN